MDKQKIFDQILSHSRNQERQAQNHTYSGCKYRLEDPQPDGSIKMLKCFIGCLIPDQLYTEDMENKRIYASEMQPIADLLGVENDEDRLWLTTLQIIHDGTKKEKWENELAKFAAKQSLVYVAP